jgi:hypothetical protein
MEMGQTSQQRAHVYMSICATAIYGCGWIHERAGEILSILLIMHGLIISQD